EGADVDERGDTLVRARLADDRSAVGVSDEDRRPVLAVEDHTRCFRVPFKRKGRVLHDAHRVAVGRQDVVDTLPPRAVDEAAVNQHDARLVAHRLPPPRPLGCKPRDVAGTLHPTWKPGMKSSSPVAPTRFAAKSVTGLPSAATWPTSPTTPVSDRKRR